MSGSPGFDMGVLDDILIETRRIRWKTLMSGMQLANAGGMDRKLVEKHLDRFFSDLDQQEKDLGRA